MPRTCLGLVLLAACACVEAQPERVRHHTEDGYHLYARGSYGDARDCFKAALALKPGDPDLTFNLAQCHDRLGQRAEAETLYKQCLERDADHAEARHAWLELMIQTGRESEGRRMVTDWMRTRPKSGDAYVEDAWLRERDRDLDSARRRYQQALNLNPRNDRALVGMAGIFEKLGRRDRALVLYESALEVKPDQPEVQARVKELRAKGVSAPRPD
jgi:protein O-GlcNAc transferase